MRKELKSFIKKTRLAYNIYFILGSLCLRILKYVVRTNSQLILFVSYSGKKYDDSPRVIFESMIFDERFKNYKLVWAFEEPANFNVERAQKVKIDTLQYFLIALKARCWITNVAMERGLSFKGRETFYFNTWHGSPIKKIGSDVNIDNGAFQTNLKQFPLDVMLAQSEYDAAIYQRVFNLPAHVVRIEGFPRNDYLLNYERSKPGQIRAALKIPENKKVILYAPTFREYIADADGNYLMVPPLDLMNCKQKLSKDYVLLIKAHSAIGQSLKLKSNGFVYDVSDYTNLNELLIISDILISDYSSIFFDYSLLKRPMICFGYDYYEFIKKRGCYIDLKMEFSESFVETEEDLTKLLLTMDYGLLIKQSERIREKYVQCAKNATCSSLKIIWDNIN